MICEIEIPNENKKKDLNKILFTTHSSRIES